MIRDELWAEAETLAARSYKEVFCEETLPDGSIVVVAETPELSGCVAHGMSEVEARRELGEARTLYIYTLLEDGFSVPHPEGLEFSFAEILFAARYMKKYGWVEIPGNQEDFMPEMTNVSLFPA